MKKGKDNSLKKKLDKLKSEISLAENNLNKLRREQSYLFFERYKNSLKVKIIKDTYHEIGKEILEQINNYKREKGTNPNLLIVDIERKDYLISALTSGYIINPFNTIGTIYGIEVEWY